MWSGMYLRDGGVFNELLKMFGQEPIHWLDYDHAFGSLVLMMVWSGGGSVLNIIAAIKNISPELYEAASIDGATPLQQYRHITLPLITPMNYMALVNGLIGALQIFGEPILLSGTSLTTVPIQPIYTYMVHTYQQIFVYLRFGYGLALTWIVFAIIMTATIINDKLSKLWVYTE
jgi:ABC-type sugar transport system permease subunit